MDAKKLKIIADRRRMDILEMDCAAHTGHIGGAMSSIDVLTCLYYQVMDVEKIRALQADRDRFILSKGHCAEALYAVLCDRGFFTKDVLKTYARFGTVLAEHPTKKVPGVEIATGALGHGFSAGVGMAVGLRGANAAHVYVLMGDGEQAEGSVWEAAMAAAKYQLDNLTVIIDRNRLQISGSTEDVMPLDDLAGKYRAFGFHVAECDGHDTAAVCDALSLRVKDKPVAVIAGTIKGKGVSFMENKAEWHHQVPTEENVRVAELEITQRLEAMAQ